MGDSIKNISEKGFALGRHMTVEFYDCNSRILANAAKLKAIFLHAANVSGATVIDSYFHDFEPQGVSGVIVISESHFAVHAWPEHDYAAVDLFTCGENVNFDRAVKALAEGMESGQWIISSMMHRGIVGDNGVERLVPVIENRDCRFSLSWKSRFEAGPARAISAAIDVYECRTQTFETQLRLAEFTTHWAQKLGMTPTGELRMENAPDGWIAFELPLDEGRISGNFAIDRSTAYLTVFATRFFDPREAAEFAVRELAGSYYRMQPHVRQ